MSIEEEIEQYIKELKSKNKPNTVNNAMTVLYKIGDFMLEHNKDFESITEADKELFFNQLKFKVSKRKDKPDAELSKKTYDLNHHIANKFFKDTTEKNNFITMTKFFFNYGKMERDLYKSISYFVIDNWKTEDGIKDKIEIINKIGLNQPDQKQETDKLLSREIDKLVSLSEFVSKNNEELHEKYRQLQNDLEKIFEKNPLWVWYNFPSTCAELIGDET